MAVMRGFFRSVRGSLGAAVILLIHDAVLTGSFLMAALFCPVWLLLSLVKNAIRWPGWGLALVRIGLPALTLLVVRVNDAVQHEVAEVNVRRIIAACEAYHAVNGKFPEQIDELVPRYLESIPVAKHCVLWNHFFYYQRSPSLFWYVTPPFFRKIYNFDSRSWSYLD